METGNHTNVINKRILNKLCYIHWSKYYVEVKLQERLASNNINVLQRDTVAQRKLDVKSTYFMIHLYEVSKCVKVISGNSV